MDEREQLIKELDRIIEIGIVDAKRDRETLSKVRHLLTETEYETLIRILMCSTYKWCFKDFINKNGLHEVSIKDVTDVVTLLFDKDGRLWR